MNFQKFCESFVRVDRAAMSFEGRDYLREIYAAAEGNLVLRCGRQVEKTTLLTNLVAFNAVRQPGIKMLYVCPRQEQASVFSR